MRLEIDALRRHAFTRVLGVDRESSKTANFMFYGFTVAWLIVIGYVISITVREKRSCARNWTA